VPAAWHEAYRRDLGVTPTDDAEGCLQDGHWAAGMFGYFPTYTLGNLMAAQLMAQARHDLGDIDEAFASGDFSGLLTWLNKHVHRHGSKWPTADLVKHVTGTLPDTQPLLSALHERYGRVYGLI
jgi:carboxypeptidase Taq